MTTTRKILIDTDPGVDDAFALFYALNHPKLETVGITTIFGNVTTEKAAHNARYLVKRFCNKTIPVAKGSDRPYARPEHLCGDFVHGEDGLGNTFQAHDVGENHPLPAHDFIVQQILKYPHELTLVCIAPSTNLALALDAHPEIIHLVKEVVVMGGAVHVNGNVNPAAEANVRNDPEAAEKILNAGWPITLFPLDVTDNTLIPPEAIEGYRNHGELGEFLHDISLFYQKFYHDYKIMDGERVRGLVAHDILPFKYLTMPDAFTFREGGVHVVTGDSLLRGKLIMDDRPLWYGSHEWSDLPKVKVCFDVDYDKIIHEFNSHVEAICQDTQRKKSKNGEEVTA